MTINRATPTHTNRGTRRTGEAAGAFVLGLMVVLLFGWRAAGGE